MKKLITIVTASLLTMSSFAFANIDPDLKGSIVKRWEIIEFTMDKGEKLAAYADLSDQVALALTATEQKDPEILTWAGIVNASYAGEKGGFGALKLVKKAKKQLETALSIDEDAASGGAMTTLGTLYAQVPGWPIGFGDDKKATELLRKSTETNPDNLVALYFYGKHLLDQKQTEQARSVFEKAITIKPRSEAQLSDNARLSEMESILNSMK